MFEELLHAFDPGSKVICQYNDWWNAFGDKNEKIEIGMRLTIKGSRNIGGTSFLEFEEMEPGNYFMWTGFKPMKALN